MSAVIQNEYTGNNSTTQYSFTFPYLKTSDIKASLDGVDTTAFTLPNATTLQFNTAPGSGVKIKIFRQTSVDDLTATFYAGSAIKSEDLNDNFTQNLYKTQEVGARFVSKLGSTMTGDLNMGEDTVIKFEGATDNAHETTLTVVDPTADRTITLPNVTGTVVTTGDTGTVATAMIAGDAVNGDKIADNAINSEHYVDGSIDTAHIADAQVTTAKIADTSVTTGKLAADAVTAAKLADNAVVTANIVDANVTTDKIANSSVTNAKLANNSVQTGNIVDNAIQTAKIQDSQVTLAKMADDSVGTAELVDGSVDTARLADNSVTLAKMTDDSVGTSELVDASVTTAKIATGAVTEPKIPSNAIIADKIASGAVIESKLATNAVTTDKIADTNVTTAKIADSGITTAKIAGANVTDVKLASNSVVTSKITDANVTTVKIADSNVTLAKLASDLKQTTIADSDTQIPTSGAVVDYVAAQLAPIGGLEVIATEVAFPNTQPAAGVVISIADAGGIVVNGSGTSTTGRTVGGSTVTINNINSAFNSSTVDAGVSFMVSSTGSGQVYNFHKATLKESDIINLSNDINDFGNRYRVFAGEPSSNNDEGDLVYDTNANKMKVYDTSTSAWKEVTSTGDFKYLFLCPAGGSGAPTINGSIATYDLRESSNSGSAAAVTSAAQLIVSINGVIQKANTGTSAPSEGFALVDSNTIVFGTNLPTGASVFIIQIGSAVTVPVPGDGTVSEAKIASGAVTTAKIADGAVTEPKIASNAVITSKIADSAVTGTKIADATIALSKLEHGTSSNDGKFLRANNGADPTFETVTGTTINNNADNRLITGSGTANTLEAESGLTFDGTELKIGGDSGVTGTWGLEVYNTTGTVGTGVFAGNSGAEIKLQDTVSGETIKIAANGQASFYSQKENDPMVFFTKPTGGSDTERLRISGDGNVGIGNNNPDQKLKIQDSSDVAIHILKTGSQDTLLKNTGQTELCAASGGASGQRIVFKIGANTGSLSDIAKFTDSGLCFGSDTASANALDDYEEGSWSPGGSWTTISAEYIKIGRMVYAGFSLRADATSGTAQITNLPFTAANQKSAMGGIAWGLCEVNIEDGWINGFVDENTTTGFLKRNGGNSLNFGSGNNNMNNSAFIRGTFIYYAAS